MDGYAFQGAQLVPRQALELEVQGTALAGRAWQGEVKAGQCVKIMTGAVMPAGLDTVLPQEFAQDAGPGCIRVPADVVQPGDNRRCCGEDLMQGDVALVHQQMRAAANGKNVWIVGGGELAGQFLDRGLLDELIVQIMPVVLGSGLPLLPRAVVTPALKLTSATPYKDTFVEMRYEVVRG
jgi:hypothetical protein